MSCYAHSLALSAACLTVLSDTSPWTQVILRVTPVKPSSVNSETTTRAAWGEVETGERGQERGQERARSRERGQAREVKREVKREVAREGDSGHEREEGERGREAEVKREVK